jgi:polysaccharide biosynthesis transport protein
MSFHQFLSIIKARKLVFLLVLCLTVIGTAAISLVLPKRYTSKAEVILDVKSPDPVAGFILQGALMTGYMATQVDILQSDRVAMRVVKLLKLDENAALQDDWRADTEGQGDIKLWVAKLLQRQLEVKPGRESNVIEIMYTGQDPRFAAVVNNAFVQSYIDTTLELRIEPAKQFSAMFETQASQTREKLEAAQAKLSAYQREKGLLATDERMDVENARLGELSSQVVALQALSAETDSRRAQSGANSSEVLNNPLIASLKADLARQEARLNEIAAKYGPSYPVVQELQANISELRATIATEVNRVSSSASINSTVSNSRLAQARASLEAQREKILQLKQQRDAATVLVREVESAQRAYDAVQARLQQSTMESQTSQTNIAVLMPASPPLKPSGPKVLLNTALAAVLGGLLAVGLVLGLEFSDRKLRTPADVAETLQLKLLSVLPDTDLSGVAGDPAARIRLVGKAPLKLAAPRQ